jgi:hypothetical protein
MNESKDQLDSMKDKLLEAIKDVVIVEFKVDRKTYVDNGSVTHRNSSDCKRH